MKLPEIFERYNKYSDLGLSGETPPAVSKALEITKSFGIAGDYYEFGIYAGAVFHHAQREADRLGLNEMHFWGFDSFEGLPTVEGLDYGVDHPEGYAGFETSSYACSLEIVRKLHNQFGVDWNRVHLIEGWFSEALTETLAGAAGMKPAAVVLVDCDLYASTVPVLRFMEPLLQDGTIILFDDWGNFDWKELETGRPHGEKLAFQQFLTANPRWSAEDFITFGSLGRGFTMRVTIV